MVAPVLLMVSPSALAGATPASVAISAVRQRNGIQHATGPSDSAFANWHDGTRVIAVCECLGLGVRVWFVVRQIRTRSGAEGGLL
jgi:hypothetical protein